MYERKAVNLNILIDYKVQNQKQDYKINTRNTDDYKVNTRNTNEYKVHQEKQSM